jgi:PEP-CTERM motif
MIRAFKQASPAGKFIAACGLLLSMAAAAPASAAVSITGASTINNSAANTVTGGTGIARSWHTDNSLTTGALSLNNHFMYQNSLVVVQPDGPDFALTSPRVAAYDMTFTILDPTNSGYSVSIDTLLRGYRTARSDNGIQVSASAGAFSGRIDTNMSDATDTLGAQVSGLTLSGGGVNTTTSVNSLLQQSKSFNAGTFFGTRTFGLRFTTFGSPNNVFIQNNGAGEMATRFGLDPVNSSATGAPAFDDAFYPGVDGEPRSAHGHFVDVRVTSLSPVPEPQTYALLLAGLGLMGYAARRRKPSAP